MAVYSGITLASISPITPLGLLLFAEDPGFLSENDLGGLDREDAQAAWDAAVNAAVKKVQSTLEDAIQDSVGRSSIQYLPGGRGKWVTRVVHLGTSVYGLVDGSDSPSILFPDWMMGRVPVYGSKDNRTVASLTLPFRLQPPPTSREPEIKVYFSSATWGTDP